MDTPLAAAVNKENVYVGGGKTTTTKKPIKLKPAGKARKALKDLRETYAPSAGVLNDVDLKPMTHGKQQITMADLFTAKKKIANKASEVANLNTHSPSLGDFEMWIKPLNHLLSDKDIKQCYEWAKEGIEGADCSSWSIEDNCYSCSIPGSGGLEQPFLSDDEGYEIDDPDLHCPMSSPGPLSSFYSPEKLDDSLGVSGIALDEFPSPKLKLEDDFCLDNDNIIDGEERDVCSLTELVNLCEKIYYVMKKEKDDKSLRRLRKLLGSYLSEASVDD